VVAVEGEEAFSGGGGANKEDKVVIVDDEMVEDVDLCGFICIFRLVRW
jgi:hypothetical protein